MFNDMDPCVCRQGFRLARAPTLWNVYCLRLPFAPFTDTLVLAFSSLPSTTSLPPRPPAFPVATSTITQLWPVAKYRNSPGVSSSHKLSYKWIIVSPSQYPPLSLPPRRLLRRAPLQLRHHRLHCLNISSCQVSRKTTKQALAPSHRDHPMLGSSIVQINFNHCPLPLSASPNRPRQRCPRSFPHNGAPSRTMYAPCTINAPRRPRRSTRACTPIIASHP